MFCIDILFCNNLIKIFFKSSIFFFVYLIVFEIVVVMLLVLKICFSWFCLEGDKLFILLYIYLCVFFVLFLFVGFFLMIRSCVWVIFILDVFLDVIKNFIFLGNLGNYF